MAYIRDPDSEDPARLQMIRFIPIKMVDEPRMNRMPQGVFGDNGAYPPISPVLNIPAEIRHAYTTMTVCDLQRHLIGAGKRIGADGEWGPASHAAFIDWAKRRPLSEARSVMATGSSPLPRFGAREDYRMEGQQIRVPAIYAMSLPPMARVQCAASRGTARSPAASPPPDAASPPAGSESSTGTESSGTPWLAIGLGAAAVLAIAAVVMTSKKEARR